MSEPVMQRLKISREGIILIKSFEGFRPHAVRRDDGRWVIGYGHTLSAREGGVVSEADAELLLQYDLLPVAAALNGVPGSLNQHQFDALASFVHSIGLDRFQGSDVLSRLTAGAQGEAADAIIGWADPSPADAGMRRRAAERALFVADPGRPVALAELLSAPLPPPPVSAPEISVPDADTGTDTAPAAEEPIPAHSSPDPEVETAVADTALIDLPASDDRPGDVETSPGEGDDSAAVLETPTAIDAGESPADPTPVLDAGEGPPDDVTDDASPLDTDAIAADLPEPHHPSVFDPTAQASDDFLAGADTETQVSPTGFGTTASVPGSQRYSAYAGEIVGPLPGLAVEAAPPSTEIAVSNDAVPAVAEQAAEPAPIEIPTFQPSIAAA
ncbi:glycoside hydrolase family protein, partial [Brevundimonas sp.]|uniref:glycoside hydrolase family protein n=1 Tax=Brevundimonas sp. TaxID=1871086 RepID=UPI003782E8BE